MTPELLQGKRKRDEEEEEQEEQEERVLTEPTREKEEKLELEPELKPEYLDSRREIAEQPEQDQPLKLVKKTHTQHTEQTGKILNFV